MLTQLMHTNLRYPVVRIIGVDTTENEYIYNEPIFDSPCILLYVDLHHLRISFVYMSDCRLCWYLLPFLTASSPD